MKKTTSAGFFRGHAKFSSLLLAVAAMTLAVGAHAQAAEASNSGSGYSMYGPGSSYVGINAGRSNFRLNNGLGGFPSDKSKNAYSIYGGGYFNNNFGFELGYADFGRIARAGGSTKAEGINLSLVGKLPLNQSFNLLGRVGTTYGRTDVSAVPASGIAGGRDSSFNLSYGVGAEYAFNPSLSAVLQYDEYNLKFVTTGRERINTTSVGLRYRF